MPNTVNKPSSKPTEPGASSSKRKKSHQGPIAPVGDNRKIVGFRFTPSIRLLMKRLRDANPVTFCFRKPRPRKPDSGRDYWRLPPLPVRRVRGPGERPKNLTVNVFFRWCACVAGGRSEMRNSAPSEEIQQHSRQAADHPPMIRLGGRPGQTAGRFRFQPTEQRTTHHSRWTDPSRRGPGAKT